MGLNYDRFLHILSKWPVNVNQKSYDYGYHLRELLKKKDLNGNIFPGSVAENSKMLDSLLRLANDHYKKRYPCNIGNGASGVTEEIRKSILEKGEYQDFRKKEG